MIARLYRFRRWYQFNVFAAITLFVFESLVGQRAGLLLIAAAMWLVVFLDLFGGWIRVRLGDHRCLQIGLMALAGSGIPVFAAAALDGLIACLPEFLVFTLILLGQALFGIGIAFTNGPDASYTRQVVKLGLAGAQSDAVASEVERRGSALRFAGAGTAQFIGSVLFFVFEFMIKNESNRVIAQSAIFLLSTPFYLIALAQVRRLPAFKAPTGRNNVGLWTGGSQACIEWSSTLLRSVGQLAKDTQFGARVLVFGILLASSIAGDFLIRLAVKGSLEGLDIRLLSDCPDKLWLSLIRALPFAILVLIGYQLMAWASARSKFLNSRFQEEGHCFWLFRAFLFLTLLVLLFLTFAILLEAPLCAISAAHVFLLITAVACAFLQAAVIRGLLTPVIRDFALHYFERQATRRSELLLSFTNILVFLPSAVLLTLVGLGFHIGSSSYEGLRITLQASLVLFAVVTVVGVAILLIAHPRPLDEKGLKPASFEEGAESLIEGSLAGLPERVRQVLRDDMVRSSLLFPW